LQNGPTAAYPAAARDARSWIQILARYRDPSLPRSVFEIVITAIPWLALWALSCTALLWGYSWLSLLIAVPAAAFLVRLFLIQHDCGHGAFFPRRSANDWVGRLLGVLTMTPYDFWRHTHALHHAGSGHLERRGIGDIDTLTVREYLTLSAFGRLRYRAYRHPFVMVCIGPVYFFLFQQRLPIGFMRGGWQPWVSTMATNFAIVAISAIPIWFIGLGPFLFVQLPIIVLAASMGGWLFYVQHQFETTSWAHEGEWSRHDAALHGSSHYDLPTPLRWVTANIGVHHVHHLCSGIPYYRLQSTLRDHPDLRAISRLTLQKSFSCVHLALWDEGQRRLITFREAHKQDETDDLRFFVARRKISQHKS
jgi:acyl-lipid omega-6 desaturase (Delta-12 desaturase)